MKGSNGLSPRDQQEARVKCPDRPTKRRYHTIEEAEKAAAISSQQYHSTVVPYACAGCGDYHLTGRRAGSDVTVSKPGEPVVTAAMAQRASYQPKPTLPERKEIPLEHNFEVFIKPGNKEARIKALAAYLEGEEQVALAEVAEHLGCSTVTAAPLMKAAGWTAPRGPGARWRRRNDPLPTPLRVVEPAPPEVVPLDGGWDTLGASGPVGTMTIAQLISTAEMMGKQIRIQMRDYSG